MRLSTANVAHLPVVSRGEGKLVGYLGWRDMMKAKTRLAEEESTRTSFFSGSQKNR